MSRLSPIGRLQLVREILLAYVRVRRAMHGRELSDAVATLRTPAPSRRRSARRRPLPDGRRDGERLGHAVARTLNLLPFDGRCLMRSLVLLRLLARRGTDGTLVIAVQPDGADGLNAHAWIELGGRPLLAPAEEYGRLLTL